MSKYNTSGSSNLVKSIVFMLYASVCLNDYFLSGFLSSFAQQLLPQEEVKVLQTIFSKLQIKDWNVTPRSCMEIMSFNKTIVEKKVYRGLTCNCSINGETLCHIQTIQVAGYNLSGVIPAEFAELKYLTELDLGRNYFNGSIPSAFGLLNLTILELVGNRIGGIPKEIGNIATLEELRLESNLLEGPLPESLGQLSRLRRLLLSGNNFNGTIPESLRQLKNLTDFRIDGSNLSGTIPHWIGNWTRIEKIHMQGTSLNGPIPTSISQLKTLTELRISDLSGPTTSFPNFESMTNLSILMLRNCSITGQIPGYLQNMKLKTIDLMFNKLTGPIPFQKKMDDLDNLFLSHNALTGQIPNWISESAKPIDISYNSFTTPSQVRCTSNVNAASSYFPNSSMVWCARKGLPCSTKPKYTSLYINCGGGETKFGKNVYVADELTQGPAYFSTTSDKWAYSSTGLFISENADAKFAVHNTFSLKVTEGEIYETARLAAVSLKYYGLCMKKGSYKVQLHFAEIMFSNDKNYSSLGRRIFNVAIQGKVVLPDYNIAEKAKGVGKGIIEVFNEVDVNGSTLEIHLYWSGKGTSAVPERNVQGPLISAITVTPNFPVGTGRFSPAAIAGIVTASCVMLLLTFVLLWKKGYLGGKHVEDIELRGLDLQTGYFTLRQIKAATNNFDRANKIGEGGFGPVYKGVLADGAVIAVKQLSAKSKQGNREFVNEVGMISALQHPNLVKLYGCCIEGNQLLLIYEYMENNCLARALFGDEEQRLNLDWPTRKNICLGIARGLAYLHEESRLKIVHRDIKATNVLLDKDLNAKISDFGLAKLDNEEDTHISTRIAGTVGYMAPEYAMRGYLTDKADVYSFGIVALEIVSGKSNTNYRPKEEFVYLLDWAYVLEEQDDLLELVDSSLGSSYPEEEALRMLNLALLCTNPSPTLRPAMSSVVSMLEGNAPVHAPVVKRGERMDHARFKAFEKLPQESVTHVSRSSQDSLVVKNVSTDDGPWIDSSSSLPAPPPDDDDKGSSQEKRLLPDLYDVNLD